MCGLKRLLMILFVLILAGLATAGSTQTGDEYLEHIFAVPGSELTVYDNPELTKFGNSVETDVLLIVDRFYENNNGNWVAHISEPDHLEGYVAVDKLIEVMAVWSDTLNIREEAGLSARKTGTAKRGETVILPHTSTYYTEYYGPPNEDGYYWRNCLIGDDVGWVAEDFLIEKCYFDALEPALELYDAGELKSMRTYLEELDRNYADIDCEIASDGRSAIVVLGDDGWYHDGWYYTNPYTTKRLYLVGELDRMFYGNTGDYIISDDGRYSLVTYSFVGYGGGGVYTTPPYTVFDNHVGNEVFSEYLFPHSFRFLEDKYPASKLHAVEFIDENHLLMIEHDAYPEVTDWEGTDWSDEIYPCLTLINMTTGEGVVLLEPDWDWLEARGEGISGGVRLRRNSNCSSPSPVIKAAMQTELFHLCEEELVSGFYSEG